MDYDRAPGPKEIEAGKEVDRIRDIWYENQTPENWKAVQDAYDAYYAAIKEEQEEE